MSEPEKGTKATRPHQKVFFRDDKWYWQGNKRQRGLSPPNDLPKSMCPSPPPPHNGLGEQKKEILLQYLSTNSGKYL